MTNPLPHELSGNKASDQLLVFMHGYPDTTAIWDPIVAPLEKESYILNVSYPNYSTKETNPKGLDLDQILERLKVTIDTVNDSGRKIVIVSHDWGAIYSYWFDQKYPNYVSEIIGLDVALISDITFFKVFYQVVLALAFIIGGPIGNFMTRMILKLFKHKTAWDHRINSSWNYPYYYLWKRILTGAKKKQQIPFLRAKLSCNVVYVWGTKKPVQFHNDTWLKMLQKNPNNETHAVKASHWIMTEQPAFLIDLIKRRLLNLKKIIPRA